MSKSHKSTKVKVPNHIHLYKRIDLVPKWKQIKDPEKHQPYLVFVCIKPACNHRMPVQLAFGKLCECNRCNNPMILDKESITHAKPHCQDCIKRKHKPEVSALTELLKDI